MIQHPEMAPLTSLMYGFRATQAIYVLAKLGVADRLAAGPLTGVELATLVHADPNSLRRVLRHAAFLGLLSEEADGRFGLTELGDPLRNDHSNSVTPMAIMLGEQHYAAWGELVHTVRTGESAFEHIFGREFFDFMAHNPDAQATFDAAMAVGNDETFARPLAETYDFSKALLIVDVGGGNGSVSASILQVHPHLKATIYDQPQVLPAADAYLLKEGVRERCTLAAGNFFASIPAGGDRYMLSNIVHDWDDERATLILRNCRKAMEPNARLMLLEAVMPPHGHPSRAAMQDVNMMVLLHGMERTEEEFRELLAASGFQLSAITPVSDRISLIEGRPS